MAKRKKPNDNIQHYTKTDDRATQTLLKAGSELRCSCVLSVPVPHVTPVVLLLIDTNII